MLLLLPQTWDKDLAVTAREWARKCRFEHNPDLKRPGRVPHKFSSVGENIWTAYPSTQFNATRAIQSWVDEKLDYDYHSNGCSNVCGHYKQVGAEMPQGLRPYIINAPAGKTCKQNAEFCCWVSLGCLGQDEQSWLCCPILPEWS